MASQNKNSTKVKKGGSHMDASALFQFLDTEKIAKRVRENLGLIIKTITNDSGDVVDEKEKVEPHALMNKTGIKTVMAKFRGVVDKNQALSKYEPEEIKNLMRDEHETLARDLIVNWGRYGINDRSQLDEVVAIVTNNEYSILKRAEGGMTLENLAEVSEEISKTNTEFSEDDGGWF
ncbi:MAG: hypothetical protein ABEK04_03535 [Candidatus Nanohalobium sp.]